MLHISDKITNEPRLYFQNTYSKMSDYECTHPMEPLVAPQTTVELVFRKNDVALTLSERNVRRTPFSLYHGLLHK